MARFVNCSGCHADISDDREACPHCGTKVVPALEAELKQTSDENVARFVQQIVALERSNGSLSDQVKTLLQENSNLRAENAELHKQQGV